MSGLICPLCRGSTREVYRNGVLIDTGTQRWGVWLDRGEREKLATVAGGTEERSFLGHAMAAQRDRRQHRDDDDHDDRRYGHPARTL